MVPELPLHAGTLRHHARRVAVPAYDRAALTPGAVHLSVGSFHRSHQAVYFDELAARGHTEWGLVGVGLRRPEMQKVLALQDGLYTVVTRGNGRPAARVIGAMTHYLYAPAQRDAVLLALADERTAVVTLTITGDGYKVDTARGAFEHDDPEVALDLADPLRPSSALGYLVEALDRRRRAGLAGFTILSCDNHPDNGEIARRALTSFARLRDPRLAEWIEERVSFPSSMVDRITPATTLADRHFLQREFGVDDLWPVITEPFSHWVVEDEFCNRRPPLEEAGVHLVRDVRPYSLMKTRLLNATHCAIGYLGHLAGHLRTDQVMNDPVFRDYVTGLMDNDVTPILSPVPGVDLEDYKRTLLERLENRQIRDSLSRLCRAGSTKVPAHVVSSLAEARSRGREHPFLTLAVAGWFSYLRDAAPGEVDDPLAGRLQALARAGGDDPRPLLREHTLFGPLGDDPGFATELERAIEGIERAGARGALAAAVGDAALVPA